LQEGTKYYVRAYATNGKTTGYGNTIEFTTVGITAPTVTTTAATNITTTTAQTGGNVTSDGNSAVIARGVVWNTTGNPTVESNLGKTGNGNGPGVFTSPISNLQEGTKYYVRAYATNGKTTGYGNTIEFTTVGITAPTVTTTAATNITTTTAQTGGNVTSDGNSTVTARGVVWNTTGNPTVESNQGKTSNGSGTGVFTSQLSNLQEGATYYVRAYATNGKTSAYGNVIEFTTIKRTLAAVTTTAITTFTATSAVMGGNITSGGNTPVTEHGIVFSTTSNPTTANTKVPMGSGTGSFSRTVNGLALNTTYYVKAYAINAIGTAYGDPEVSFKTPDNPYGIEMITVQGGTFQMGSYTGESDEVPVHSVTLSAFQIGKTEVTQAQWEAVMGSYPSYFSGANLPVEKVSWNDIQTFLTKLNQQTGGNYRLPTEAEWEYAARGGKNSKGYEYSGSNTIGDVAWYDDNSGSTTHTAATKTANELGLFDMTGNVSEWCDDWYGSYSSAAQTNPTGPSTGYDFVIRGGGWDYNASGCRVAFRDGRNPGSRNPNLGFRLARSL
jgi:formylglycine-generating enzyme required for sulfatase activity